MASFDIDAYLARTGALDVSDIAWDDVPKHPISAEAIRTLRYMQDIESHTIVYLRSLYYRQAEARLQRPAVARVARFLVDRFWAPVGSGVQPAERASLHGELPLLRCERARRRP